MANTPENPTPDQSTPSTPSAASEQEGRQNDSAAAASPAAGEASPPTSTQSNLGNGEGIRGSYGDASQTNGLEGGPDSDEDGSPKGQ
ncbi:hypothetical protein [Hymenobacter persicinus]|uniref:Uncharacterized protein n=1 Tax=Hymenobacter persicinus TaxID=2025506 RepID=A0A4Q5LAU4_9BACT|nr:hypothetical protein [Hymenobacter persicinus]RYU79134.1 hypothetical protein EWM57_11415 [Hymenobacter persicinus]